MIFLLRFDNFVLRFDNFVLCFDNFVLCFKNSVVFPKHCIVFADVGHSNFWIKSLSALGANNHDIGFYCLLTILRISVNYSLTTVTQSHKKLNIFCSQKNNNLIKLFFCKHFPFPYGLLTKREVKMAGYWIWAKTKLRSVKTQKKNKANIQQSWLNKLGQ